MKITWYIRRKKSYKICILLFLRSLVRVYLIKFYEYLFWSQSHKLFLHTLTQFLCKLALFTTLRQILSTLMSSLQIKLASSYAKNILWDRHWYNHRDRTRASTLCFFYYFFSTFEHVKSLLIMGPNNTENS